MGKYSNKTIWFVLLLIFLFLWFKKENGPVFRESRPTVESLDFNNPETAMVAKPAVYSSDEEINVSVFEKAHPAVVNIASTTLSMNFWMEVIPRQGQGSGFIIDRRGYILTNNHVVAKAQKLTVTTAKGKKIDATLVGRDPRTDLAVIRIPAGDVEAVATLGDSDKLRPGQKAIAIGNPFGLSHTLTTGIVSALHRSIRTEEGNEVEDLIQTDAAINPGNSGGPLLDSNGDVIGINTAIFSLSGGYQGIGFAIPINLAKRVATQLITSGRVARPWLGISGLSLSPYLAESLGLNVKEGVLVVQVLPGGPAYQAGLKGGDREVLIRGFRIALGGDIITDVDGTTVEDMKQLVHHVEQMKVGATADLGIMRNGFSKRIRVKLLERP
ncbi:MAG: trypsin-like peptidase domain-containing protein [Deltaproteobacteria bacterium]|nr:trypsin-like peptidase domain-containing protein [Deltaproteobacteria bacterium]